jgi:hypothetical protein
MRCGPLFENSEQSVDATVTPCPHYLLLIRGERQILHLARLLHQLYVETQALQLANQHVE